MARGVVPERRKKRVANRPVVNGGGRVVGTPNKLTKQAIERMEELNFDPLEFAVAIARGEELCTDHPVWPILQQWLLELKDVVASKQWASMPTLEKIDQFASYCEKLLKESYTPIDVRSRHTLELLNYVYPKRKAMEVDFPGNSEGGPVKELTADEVKIFHAYFHKEY